MLLKVIASPPIQGCDTVVYHGRAALLHQTADHIGLEKAARQTSPAEGSNGRAAVKTHPREAASSAKQRSRKLPGVSAEQGQAIDVLGATAGRPSGASTGNQVEGAINSESETLRSEGDPRPAWVSQQAEEVSYTKADLLNRSKNKHGMHCSA